MPDTGWLDCGTLYSDDTDVGPAWDNLTDGESEDGNYASVTDTDPDNNTDILRGQNLTESIPVDATVVGVEVRIKWWKSDTFNAANGYLKLHKDGTSVGDSKSTWEQPGLSNAWSNTYGGPTDTWNTGYTISDFKDATFGVEFDLLWEAIGGPESISVDCVQIKIYYDPYVFRPLPPHFIVP